MRLKSDILTIHRNQNCFWSKFKVDLLWNICSFAICGVIGILLNIIIIRHYDAATLGYFNQIYAIFIFLSQVATWGLHLSVQKFISQYSSLKHHTSLILTSVFLTTFIFATTITFIVFALNKLPGRLFNSEAVTEGFIYAIPGLLFFSLNKILLSYLNGMRFMIAFAIFNSLRFALMLFILIAIVTTGVHSKYLALIFALPEFILFVILLLRNIKYFDFSSIHRLVLLSRLQFRFGSNAALGNIVLDLNSKVDVIILGVFLPDKSVGIYSFAAFIVDGMLQLFYVFRTNINPLITETYYNNGKSALEKMIKKNIATFYKIFLTIGITAIVLYPILLKIFNISELFWQNISVFSILAVGCILSSGYIPFQMILNQTGMPRIQSLFLFYVFITNIVLNLLLVPLFGIIGSAMATSLAFIVQMFLLKKIVINKIQIHI